jgi:hypothetical protein
MKDCMARQCQYLRPLGVGIPPASSALFMPFPKPLVNHPEGSPLCARATDRAGVLPGLGVLYTMHKHPDAHGYGGCTLARQDIPV